MIIQTCMINHGWIPTYLITTFNTITSSMIIQTCMIDHGWIPTYLITTFNTITSS